MKSERGRHIFISFLCFLQIVAVLCQSQIQDVNSPTHHRYAFASSYAWKFRFPVPSSVGAPYSGAQWRPNVRYSQEQIQLPNEYLIASNYQGRSVKEPQAGQQFTIFENQRQQFTPIDLSGQQLPTQAQRQDQQFQQQSSHSQQVPIPISSPNQGHQIALQVPLLNDQGQQIGWQFFPFPKQDQQINLVAPVQQPSQQPILYYYQTGPVGQQVPTQGIQGQQPTFQSNQILPYVARGQQPLPHVFQGQHYTLLSQEQQFGQSFTIHQGNQQVGVDGRKILTDTAYPQQTCIPQMGTNVCSPTSSVAYPAVSSSLTSDAHNQELNRLLQTYQQNLLQALMTLVQQQTHLGAHVSNGSNPPVAIAGATISDDPSGTSHLNSFTYTKA